MPQANKRGKKTERCEHVTARICTNCIQKSAWRNVQPAILVEIGLGTLGSTPFVAGEIMVAFFCTISSADWSQEHETMYIPAGQKFGALH